MRIIQETEIPLIHGGILALALPETAVIAGEMAAEGGLLPPCSGAAFGSASLNALNSQQEMLESEERAVDNTPDIDGVHGMLLKGAASMEIGAQLNALSRQTVKCVKSKF